MSWFQAKGQIAQNIKVGANLNTANSSHRFVTSLRNDISSARYSYNNEDGLQGADRVRKLHRHPLLHAQILLWSPFKPE